MLRISKLADYGIVLLAHMAGEADVAWTARRLSDRSRLPLPTVSKLLKGLSHGGLLSSERGSHGGYRLARAAAEISVAEVITTLEGPISITECAMASTGRCGLENCCPVRARWRRINDVVRSALAALTIADLLPAAGRAGARPTRPSPVSPDGANALIALRGR